MIQFLLAILLNVVFDVESFPIGPIRIKRYTRIESGPNGWLLLDSWTLNILFWMVGLYCGISFLIYCSTRYCIFCCSLHATAVERSVSPNLHADSVKTTHLDTIIDSSTVSTSSSSSSSPDTAVERSASPNLPADSVKTTHLDTIIGSFTVSTSSSSSSSPTTAVERCASPNLPADSVNTPHSDTIIGSSTVSTSASNSSSSPTSNFYHASEASYGSSKSLSRSEKSEKDKTLKSNSPCKAVLKSENKLYCCCSTQEDRLHFDPPHQNTILPRLNRGIGVFQTFCWTHDEKGAMCMILTAVTPLNVEFVAPGNTDSMIRQSREVALEFIEGHQNELGIKYPYKQNIITQFTPSSMLKEGFSGGASIVAAVVSLLKNKPIKKGVGVIGGICVNGEMEYVGKLSTKMKVAKREGFTMLIVPEVMRDDYNQLFKEEKEGIEVIFVSNFLKAVNLLFDEDKESTDQGQAAEVFGQKQINDEKQNVQTPQDVFTNNKESQVAADHVDNKMTNGIATNDLASNVPNQNVPVNK
uniref:Lon proteolytic domain-containing protein n=1 Tax=Meloidogyne javanica TaxID=6303 RepID=A0A915M6Z0_MELJA